MAALMSCQNAIETCKYFLLKDTHNADDAELARKLYENEKGLRARRQAARKPVVGLFFVVVVGFISENYSCAC